ncbi:MAG TPA: hypothetical protein VKB41_14080 [Steroidobacteraceae bacterium]|nr:hypothetical protein [Steroidobacteraceae bacterium]
MKQPRTIATMTSLRIPLALVALACAGAQAQVPAGAIHSQAGSRVAPVTAPASPQVAPPSAVVAPAAVATPSAVVAPPSAVATPSAVVVPPSTVAPAVKASATDSVVTSPASTPVASPVSVSPAVKATNVSPVSRAGAAQGGAAPANLFQLDNNAIIIIGGKQQRAGDVKKAINAELTRTPQGTSRDYHVASHTPRPTTSPAVPAAPVRHVSLAEMQVPSVASPGNASRVKAERPKSCAELEPLIDRARSPAVSGAPFTLDGFCFGDRPGSVELIGQFPGGVLRPSFQQWKDDQLIVVVPSLRGVPDQTTALTVVRADGKRSAARKLQFIAARERIEVPMHYWNPTGDFDQTVVTEDGGNIFSGFHATGIASQVAGNFNIHVGQQCALDNLDVPATAGGVVSVTGFEDGPPNQAAIVLTYAPSCTTKTFDYVIGNESTTVCRVAFQLHTWANCPAGTTP